MSEFMKKPCSSCPFRHDIKPFLHPERAYEIAIHSQNRYNSFTCHKTLDSDRKECAGFLTMRANELGEADVFEIKQGFKPAYDLIFSEPYEMEEAAEEQWDEERAINAN